jgi:hypothetical protein
MKPVTPLSLEPLLSTKELAAALRDANGRSRSRGYVQAMKRRGFQMPGRRATLSYAIAWLDRNPGFSWRSVYKSTEGKHPPQPL